MTKSYNTQIDFLVQVLNDVDPAVLFPGMITPKDEYSAEAAKILSVLGKSKNLFVDLKNIFDDQFGENEVNDDKIKEIVSRIETLKFSVQ